MVFAHNADKFLKTHKAMLTPKQRRCTECANISTLLDEIDCRISQLGITLYHNITLMLNKKIPVEDYINLLMYKHILERKLVNSDYISTYPTSTIVSKAKRLVKGCKPTRPCCSEEVPTTTSTTTVPEIFYRKTMGTDARLSSHTMENFTDGFPHIFLVSSLIVNGTSYPVSGELTIDDVGRLQTANGVISTSVYPDAITSNQEFITNITDWLNDSIPAEAGIAFYDNMKTIYYHESVTSFSLIIMSISYNTWTDENLIHYYYFTEVGFYGVDMDNLIGTYKYEEQL